MGRGYIVPKNSLFIGNGLNRCIDTEITWGDLLNKIIEKYNLKQEDEISFPLKFKSIANQILKESQAPSTDIYKELKKEMICQIKGKYLPFDAPHYDFVNLSIKNIFTTNYDYLIEYSIDRHFKWSDTLFL